MKLTFIFVAAIVLVILFSLWWVVKQLACISSEVSQLNDKFDSLIAVLQRIEENTSQASQFLSEESVAYQTWKHELEDDFQPQRRSESESESESEPESEQQPA